MENNPSAIFDLITEEMRKIIVGQERIIEEILVCFFSRGHILLEGVPGIAKTLIAGTLSQIVNASFKRIQFTPDLMPSDITGTHIYDSRIMDFRLQKGPVFTNFLLADEINRTTPKTQSALLEAMEENQVTIEGETLQLPSIFMVLATQNPLEFEGTYPLPEAQVDRFMMKILVNYPEFNEEREIIRKYHQGFNHKNLRKSGIKTIEIGELSNITKSISETTVSEPVLDYITEIVRNTRKSNYLNLGASPRGSINLLAASKTLASLRGRNYVIPDDVKYMAYPVLRHRIILKPDAEIEGITHDEVIKSVISTVNVPR